MSKSLVAGLSLALAAAAFAAKPAITAKAALKLADGSAAGTVTLTQAKHGVLIVAELSGLPAGEHAFHIHAVGKCEAPFKTAGGHFNPGGHKHGILSDDGMHAGDMPNIVIPEGGAAKVEVLNTHVTLEPGHKNSVFHEGGTAFVVHAKADDNTGDPAGNAGDRIACGVIEKE